MAHRANNLRKYSLFLLCVIFLSTKLIASDEIKEWGEVAPEYLNMTVYADDTSAAAIRIFNQGVIDLEINRGVEMNMMIHSQTKILKEKGKEFANVALRYWYKDKINGVEAQVIQPNGEIIEVDSDNIFDEEVSSRYKVKKFTFPDVQVGSILEIKYNLFSSTVHELEPWYFHQSIPVMESEIILHLAPFFSYLVKTANDPDNLIQDTTAQYLNKTRNNFETEYRYKAVNLPAIKNEPYISCLNNYRANINFQIESVKYPGYYHEFITDLTSLCNLLLDKSYEDFEEPESETEELVNSLVTNNMSNSEKAKILFEYVRDNINSDLGTSIYVSKDQEEILEQKKASDSEKNMLLKVMLQAVGFEVIPTLISTQSNGWANPSIPFLSQYNKTILLVNYNNNYFLFDARDPWITYGQLPPSSLVENALLVQRDNPNYITIPKDGLRSYEMMESHMMVSNEGKVSGNSQIMAIGYASAYYNRKLHNRKLFADVLKEDVADDFDGFSVVNSDSSLTPAAADTFYTKYDFTLDNYAENIEGEVYLKPVIYLGKSSNTFVSEKRAFPVEFGYLSKSVETNYFTLPEGYSISEMPKEITIENEYIKYHRIIVKTQDNPLTIGFSRQFEIKKLEVPVKDYPLIKNDYSRIVDADQEIIVLKYSE